ncbi:MAG: L,D-transpeptidase family protein [Microcystaceae cyanobacterium]
MHPLLSKLMIAGWTVALTSIPLSQAIAEPPSLTKFPQSTSVPKATTKTPPKTELAPVTPSAVPSQVSSPVTPSNAPQAPAPSTVSSTNANPSTVPPTATPSNPAQAKPVNPAPSAKPNTTAATSAPKPLATRLVLDISDRKVYVYQEETVIASFPVAVGKKGWETPTGNFQVIQKTENPIWENPWNGKKVPASLEGPIGVRWIGFWTDGKNTIGFHGTPRKHEKFLGQAVSHGCVRMRNPDVVALFEMVQPGTPVIVKQ